MKKLLIIVGASLLLGGCTPKDLFVKPPAGLEVTTTPSSTVYLNGESKGSTPYTNSSLKPGDYTVKLVPSSGDNLSPYETKLSLVSKASTVISHVFAQGGQDASGYTLQLQEEPSGGTYLSIISDPDTINVTIDDKPSGFTPLSKLATTPGSHNLLVTSPGFVEHQLSVKTVKGYNLIVNFKLAGSSIILTPAPTSSASASVAPSPSPSPESSLKPSPISLVDKPYVVVSDTPDTQTSKGVNVRKDASSSSDILGKAAIGEKLKYLDETTSAGWFKIEFEGSPGWVSGKYVTLVK